MYACKLANLHTVSRTNLNKLKIYEYTRMKVSVTDDLLVTLTQRINFILQCSNLSRNNELELLALVQLLKSFNLYSK